MANTSEGKKQRARKKTKISTKSDQKENRPKRIKVVKPDPNDSISMSKQLIKKKKDVRKSRLKQKTKSSKTIMSNGKPMPSLEDLEKMFEDSDDDQTDKSINYKKQSTSKLIVTTSTKPESSKVSEDTNIDYLFLPNNTQCLGEQKKIENSSSEFRAISSPIVRREEIDDFDDLPTVIFSPQKSNKKEEQFKAGNSSSSSYNVMVISSPSLVNESDDLSPTMITPEKINTIQSTTLLIGDEENKLYQKTLKPSVNFIDSNVKFENPILNDENVDSNSSDSDKTIEYNLETPHKLQNDSVYQAFSPLPSTSKDNKTFSKNDELFLECLKEINNNFIKDQLIKLEVSESSAATITIDEEAMEDPPIDISTETDNDIQIIDSTGQIITVPMNTTDTSNRSYNHEDDDDCVLVETGTGSIKSSREPDIIDLDYESIEIQSEFKTDNEDDEIIDVDALIDQNQAILEKYKKTHWKKLDSTNLVVDVVNSPNTENTANNQRESNTNKNQSISAAKCYEILDSVLAVADENQPNSEHQVVNISNHTTENSGTNLSIQNETNSDCQIIDITSYSNGTMFTRPVSNNPSQRSIPPNHNRHQFTTQEISNFFTHFYNPYELNPYNDTLPVMNYPVRNLHRDVVSSQVSSGVSDHNRARGGYIMPILSQVNQLVSSSMPRAQHSIPTSIPQRPTTNLCTPKSKRSNEYPESPISEDDLGESQSKSSGKLGDCPICMEKLSHKAIGSTICGHVFCMNCLQQAIKTDHRCPTCRKILKKNGYHKIFL